MSHRPLDAGALHAELLRRLRAALLHLYPQGSIRQNRFYIGNVSGDAGDSLVVEMEGEKAGLWHDFATGEGGDLFALWGRVYGFDKKRQFPSLLAAISAWLAHSPTQEEKKTNVRSMQSFKCRGKPSMIWDYHNAAGELIAQVFRYDQQNGKKYYLPRNIQTNSWQMPEPRPLYNIPSVLKHQKVIVVEGEKAADALIGEGYCATTAMGGAQTALHKTDWQPLTGKDVVIWPDNDAPGGDYAVRLADYLKNIAKSIVILEPPAEADKGWDAYDAIEDDIDIEKFMATGIASWQEDIMADEEDDDEIANEDETWESEETSQHHNVAYLRMEPEHGVEVYSLERLLADDTPIARDLISPRILTPGGMLVLGGAPKVGKSDFMLSFLTHMSAGVAFLGMMPSRPLRIFYLQSEIGYDYLRERLRHIHLPPQACADFKQRLFITPQTHLTLNSVGIAHIETTIRKQMPAEQLDVLVIDPIRNLFDGGKRDACENSNEDMLFFLKERVARLRDRINPNAGVILVHHTRKVNKLQKEEDPFQLLSGASSLRGYYSSGMILMRDPLKADEYLLSFELRNGKPIAPKRLYRKGGSWHEAIDHDGSREQMVVSLLKQEAKQGKVYTLYQFAEQFADRCKLGSKGSIRHLLDQMVHQGTIMFFKEHEQLQLPPASKSKYGYMCVADMYLRKQLPDGTETFLPIVGSEIRDLKEDSDDIFSS